MSKAQIFKQIQAALETSLVFKPASTPYPKPQVGVDLTATFINELSKVGGQVELVNENQLSQYLNQLLADKCITEPVLVARQTLAYIDRHFSFPISCTVAQKQHQLAISMAYAGVAETGSVVILSGPDSPTSHNFLPEIHIVLLKKTMILPHIEDVWQLMHKQQLAMPRVVNFITGPSRTADIEQTLQIGAHGPGEFHVLILD